MIVVWTALIIVAIVSYFIGSINTSIIISKLIGTDIREHGSGNAGATNMLRTYGKRIGVITLLCDALKGVIAVLLANITITLLSVCATPFASTLPIKLIKCVSAISVVLGHNYPVFFQFKGGKGISTSAAVIFMLDWRIGLIVLFSALLVMALTRYISLGSIVGATLFPISVFVFSFFIDKDYNYVLMLTSVILCVLAVFRHKSNILRLLNGTESKLGQKKEDA